MSSVNVKAGARQWATLTPATDARPELDAQGQPMARVSSALSISLLEASLVTSWRIEVHAETADGRALVGVLRTTPGEYRSRVVALASCPGVRVWHCLIEADAVSEDNQDASATLKLAACEEPLGCCGIVPLAGAHVVGGYAHDAAAAAGATVVPSGGRVTHVAAVAGPGGASVTVTAWGVAHPVITVPPGLTFEIPPGALDGLVGGQSPPLPGVEIVFGGDIVARFVSWRV